MHDQGRLRDLAEPAGDVVNAHEHGHRVGQPLLRLLTPGLQPVLVDLRLAEQQVEQNRGYRIRAAVTEAVPDAAHLGQDLPRPGNRRGVDQHQGLDPLGGAQCRAKRQEAALRVADQCGLLDTEMVEQAEQIVGGVPVGVEIAVVLGAAVQPLIPHHAAELAAQRLDLRRPHLAVHEVAVAEDNHRPGACGVLEVQLLAID